MDALMREYCFDHGIQVRKDGMLVVPKRQERRLNIENSIRKPGIRTLTIPSVYGLTLLYEGQHWIVE